MIYNSAIEHILSLAARPRFSRLAMAHSVGELLLNRSALTPTHKGQFNHNAMTFSRCR